MLEAFREAPGDLGLTEIALRTGLDKSAAQRFTNTLHQLGYLEKDARSRRYRPASRLMDFSYTFLHQNRLAEVAVLRLINASKVHGTTVNLCEMIDTNIIYTVRIPTAGPAIRQPCLVGACLPQVRRAAWRSSRFAPRMR